MSVPPSAEPQRSSKKTEERESVVVRFAGDSGDGMQLTGMQFTTESALAGNDIGTLPDFPAEIRAPAGTLAGVSAFQVNFASREVFTPGDDVDVLVAMNPAALRSRTWATSRAAASSWSTPSVRRAEPEPSRLRKATRWRTARSIATSSSRST